MAYNNRCSAEHSGVRASKIVFLIRTADVFDVGEHPCLNTKLHNAGNNGTDDLAEENRAVRDLHVVTKFQVTSEFYCPIHGNVATCLEHHHRNWAAREGISDNELSDHIKSYRKVRNGQNRTNRDDVEERLM